MTVTISGDTGIDTVGSNTVGNGQLIDGSVQLAKLGFTPPFTKEYVSPEQTITSAGLLTLPHGLGVAPKLWMRYLVCKTAELGYSVGDIVDVTHTQDTTSAWGLSIVPDATNLVGRYGAFTGVFYVLHKTTGNPTTIANANWRLVIRAWA